MFHFAHLRAGRNEDLPDGHGIDMTAENTCCLCAGMPFLDPSRVIRMDLEGAGG